MHTVISMKYTNHSVISSIFSIFLSISQSIELNTQKMSSIFIMEIDN